MQMYEIAGENALTNWPGIRAGPDRYSLHINERSATGSRSPSLEMPTDRYVTICAAEVARSSTVIGKEFDNDEKHASGSVRMLGDDERDLPKSEWFHIVLAALVVTICFNITVLSYRYFAIIRREKLDRMNKSKELVTETWYLEKEVIKKEAENRRRKREAEKKNLA
ncbi:unnamed protein product [Strongylus vulgaris]|uniref:Uncharacterized protein n=1 Tax=Strongylus vulgaris TaxID=40348 RepID=A0A3P7HZA4_STRVU|nr:unnamed protein product [Strongylus vulgaris]